MKAYFRELNVAGLLPQHLYYSPPEVHTTTAHSPATAPAHPKYHENGQVGLYMKDALISRTIADGSNFFIIPGPNTKFEFQCLVLGVLHLHFPGKGLVW